MDLNIICEDASVIVCRKPAGLATETKRAGQQDMVSLLRNYRAARGEQPYIGTVHRLDQPVEGLLVFAKTPEAAAKLSKQVQERSIGKYYYAAGRRSARLKRTADDGNGASGACGEMEPGAKMRFTDYILTDRKANQSTIVPEKTPQAKKAVLDCRMLAKEGDTACFDIILHTGRHHQIRVQMAHHGWPLIGDLKYGAGVPGEQLALCAYRVTFIHPATGRPMDFSIRPENPVILKHLRPS